MNSETREKEGYIISKALNTVRTYPELLDEGSAKTRLLGPEEVASQWWRFTRMHLTCLFCLLRALKSKLDASLDFRAPLVGVECSLLRNMFAFCWPVLRCRWSLSLRRHKWHRRSLSVRPFPPMAYFLAGCQPKLLLEMPHGLFPRPVLHFVDEAVTAEQTQPDHSC